MKRRLTLLSLLVLVLAGCVAAPAARATWQDSIFQDDNLLLYRGDKVAAQTLDKVRSLGADRVRVSIIWALIAPDAGSTTRPNFNAQDPNAYPAANWQRYDNLVRLAHARGLAVDFDVTAPMPLWASRGGGPAAARKIYNPRPSDFHDFFVALARRYDGNFIPATGATGGTGGGGIKLPTQRAVVPLTSGGFELSNPLAPPSPQAAAIQHVPRVDYWEIWNEPNQGGWLGPQWTRSRHPVEVSPRLYRALADAAWSALTSNGHTTSSDTILVGSLAPEGDNLRHPFSPMKPLTFLRALYCVSAHLRPLQGSAAQKRGCPTNVQTQAFPTAHPELFQASGFAHHPYALIDAPNHHQRDRDFVTMADLGRLTGALDRIFRVYRQHRHIPLYITEWGYQTRPPDPLGVSLGTQAAYIDEGVYMCWRNPRVRACSQYELEDSGPSTQYSPRSLQYWGTFQTGLEFGPKSHHRVGSAKPSLAAYALPIWMPRTHGRRGHGLLIWGMLRAAPNGTVQKARVQLRRKGSHRWVTLKTVTVRNAEGIFQVRLKLRTGSVRIAWTRSGHTRFSRSVRVSIR